MGMQPTDLAFPGLTADYLCLTVDEGILGEVQSAEKPRATAIRYFAYEAGCPFRDVRCTIRYVRLHTRQDVWEGPGKDRWVDDQNNQYFVEHGTERPLSEWFEEAPKEAPSSWEPDEGMPCWSFCEKKTPNAIRVYICEIRDRSKEGS